MLASHMELSNPELELELLNAESQRDSAQAKLAAQKVILEDTLLGQEASLAQMEASHREATLRAEVDQKQFDDPVVVRGHYFQKSLIFAQESGPGQFVWPHRFFQFGDRQ